MATKTERIMSYLPATFKAAQTHSPLKAVVDTFGTELLNAENSLAALMRAHWVDHADKGAAKIDDLSQLAALYGLAPRLDEDVEEFREHLKQYVKTLLEGTVTVQGLLRIAANNLGLTIADNYADMDVWWTRENDQLILLQHCGNDAAAKLFNKNQLESVGQSASAAQVKGTISLSDPVDLTSDGAFAIRTLRIKINNKAKVTIDLIAAANDPTAITANEVIEAINTEFSAKLAALENGKLILTALTLGATSKITVEEHPNDAAPLLLGLLSHVARGQAVSHARITSNIDLAGSNDLSNERYLRIRVDGTQLAEIDCAGADPAATTLGEIRDAINAGFSSPIASHDGQFLTLQSSVSGSGSSLAFLNAAAQDATEKLFGTPPTLINGQDKLAAQIVSPHDYKTGVDLSESYTLRIRVNTSTAVNVDCRGLEPSNSQLPEIVNVINDTLGKNVASQNGHNLVLTSTSQGVGSKLTIEHVDENDAGDKLLGIRPRAINGSNATSAQIKSDIDLSAGSNLLASYTLRMALDHLDAIDINVASAAADAKTVSLSEMVDAINFASGSIIASHDGQFLNLTSSKSGSASALKIIPLETENRRRFVTRAKILDEASDKIFGFNSKKITGQDPIAAQISGSVDLSRGVDLRTAQYLTIQLNQDPPVTINCAGPRPRATLLSEVIDNINTALAQKVAIDDNGFLKLFAPAGAEPNKQESNSRIEFHSPRVTDAIDTLLSVPLGTVRGSDALGISFVGTNDLSGGIDLSVNHTLKMQIDNDGPLEINCSGLVASQTSLAQIAIAINVAFAKNYATHDGSHIILTSLLTGSNSLLEIQTPAAADATTLILGVTAPRIYHGSAASSAKVRGTVDLSSDSNDLSDSRFLQLGADSSDTQAIDCAENAVDPENVTQTEIIDAINLAIGAPVASNNGGLLTLTSPTQGLSSRITLQAHTGSDARYLLLGEVDDIYQATSATSALLQGEIDLSQGVDLSERNQLRIAFNGERAVNIRVLGATPDKTFAEEVADEINQLVPQSTRVTEAGFLEIESDSSGAKSSVEVLPIRYLELQEYLPGSPASQQHFAVLHGTAFSVNNSGVASVDSEISILAPQGTYGAGLVNHDTDWHLRLLSAVHADEKITIKSHPQFGLEATVSGIDSKVNQTVRKIAASDILVGPLLPQMHVPTANTWHLARGVDNIDGLVLNNPLAPNIVQLQSQLTTASDLKTSHSKINIEVTEAKLSEITIAEKQNHQASGNSYQFIGKLILDNNIFKLQNENEQNLTQLLPANSIDLSNYVNHVVVVIGDLLNEQASLQDETLVTSIAILFDIKLNQKIHGKPDVNEFYHSVTIGENLVTPLSIEQKLIFSGEPSKLIRAAALEKDAILKLAKGRSHWRFIECDSSRFNVSHFSDSSKYFSRFAGGHSIEQGLFNISPVSYQPPERVAPVFAESNKNYIHSNQVEFNFLTQQPGTARVNLPADLAPRFGGRFNDAIFGMPVDKPEEFQQVVTEPESDPNYLIKQINDKSILVEARHVDFVPIGFAAVTIPFAKAVSFTLGNPSAAARIFLSEIDVSGFIELSARKIGYWGNQLSLVVCNSGPAIFDLMIIFPGSRFESARQTVLGDELTAVVNVSLKPGIIGVRQAKAAGVQVEVTRDNCNLSKT